MHKGQTVLLECDEERIEARITLISSNGVSLAVEFNGIFIGYVRFMPLLKFEDGEYRDLIANKVVKIHEIAQTSSSTVH